MPKSPFMQHSNPLSEQESLALMVIAWIVPGYLLQARYKKTNM